MPVTSSFYYGGSAYYVPERDVKKGGIIKLPNDVLLRILEVSGTTPNQIVAVDVVFGPVSEDSFIAEAKLGHGPDSKPEASNS